MKNEKIVLYELESECCGCSACVAVCPRDAVYMQENGEGFLYPVIDEEKCIKCRRCIKVCPLKSDSENNSESYRVGILCLSHKQNYGAKLVAWLLQEKVRAILPDAEVGVIEFEGHEERKFLEGLSQELSVKNAVNAAGGFLSEGKKKKLKSEVDSLRSEDASKMRKERFADFDKKYINKLGRADRTLEFKAIADTLDAIIIGSDIVFRPEFAKRFSDVYLLGCLKNSQRDIKKLSYAAAISSNDEKLLSALKEKYSEATEIFDYISVREKCSAEFLSGMTDKKIEYCCDPALLYRAEDFDFIEKSSDGDYIYVNILDKTDNAVKFAEGLADKKGLKIKFYTDLNKFGGENAEDTYSDGPLEFIDRIRGARYVVTNSFHTAVFSIIFHKPFVLFLRAEQSLKLVDLCETLGLSDRIVFKSKAKFDIDGEIDWAECDRRLDAFRKSSEEFLENSLK